MPGIGQTKTKTVTKHSLVVQSQNVGNHNKIFNGFSRRIVRACPGHLDSNDPTTDRLRHIINVMRDKNLRLARYVGDESLHLFQFASRTSTPADPSNYVH